MSKKVFNSRGYNNYIMIKEQVEKGTITANEGALLMCCMCGEEMTVEYALQLTGLKEGIMGDE